MTQKNRKVIKFISLLALIFLLGGVAGVLGSQLFLPWIAGFKPFGQIGWIARSRNGTTIINRTERVVVEQNTAELDVINQAAKLVVGVRSERTKKAAGKRIITLPKPEVLTEGSGFILTSDGLIATVNILAPETADHFLVFFNNKTYESRVIKRDASSGAALLKIEENNLPVAALGAAGDLKLGKEVFLLGADSTGDSLALFVNKGFIKALLPDIKVNFSESQLANGSPLFNFQGEIIGLSLADQGGTISAVLVDKIRELLK